MCFRAQWTEISTRWPHRRGYVTPRRFDRSLAMQRVLSLACLLAVSMLHGCGADSRSVRYELNWSRARAQCVLEGVRLFVFERRRMPIGDDDLRLLSSEGAPYLDGPREDWWGGRIAISDLGQGDAEARSAGPDRELGTADDVVLRESIR